MDEPPRGEVTATELPVPWQRLLAAAIAARGRAHAPYSGFAVGAAVLDEEGRIFAGCNVESSSYGLTICAERAALFAAVGGGAARIEALAVVGPATLSRPISPCGACRQVIWDLAGNVPVLRGVGDARVLVVSAAELLPDAFGAQDLGRDA